MKKILIILLVILSLIFLISNYYIPKTNLDEFKPFTENNKLLKLATNFEIKENLPSIEAASAFYPFAASVVQNIYNEKSYSSNLLKMVSTSQAYDNIVHGNTDIIIASAPSKEQVEKIKKSNIDLEFVNLYLEPLCLILNKENPISNLNINQIQDIYNNKINNWQEFGGIDKEIRTYQLEKNNGSQTCFESIVKDNKLGKNHYEIKTMNRIIDKITLDENGIGYSFYSYYSKMHNSDNTKIIDVNNINVTDENYPLLFDVYLIHRKDNNNPNIKEIVNYLNTDEGKKFINMVCF